jgi:hypothetical protein
MCLVSTYPVCARVNAQDKGQAELAKALQGVKITLEQGLAASARGGTPISGKFEVEEGKLQLSIYTMKAGTFAEVIVDHRTGKVAKTEAITSGDDLAAAKSQSTAMAKAKRSLADATAGAVKANGGSRAVSVMAALSGGRPVATITLLQGQTFKTVTEPLD